jgi:ABC-type transport system involved in cytochrome bd biosynthesis fused ATPase/permease subunit
MLGHSVWLLVRAKVASGRIGRFLSEAEVEEWVSGLGKKKLRTESKGKIGIEEGEFIYPKSTVEEEKKKETNKKDDKKKSILPTHVESSSPVESPEAEYHQFRLSNINISFPRHKLTLISGATGSGKTSLLLALFGELDIVPNSSTKIHFPKSKTYDPTTRLYDGFAYAAQTPWLQTASIRDNILFGAEWEEERYNAAVDAAALQMDFKILEKGDLTEIGEKGVALSGGQKARVGE